MNLRADLEHLWKIVDLDRDGRPDEIRNAVTDGVWTVTVRFASGVTTSKPLPRGGVLQIVSLPGGEGAGIAVGMDPAVEIWDAQLKVIAHVEPPLWDVLHVERIGLVSVPAGESDRGGAAVVTLQEGASDWHRTLLCVQALSGEILYEEVLGDDSESLLVPEEGQERGTFFVGGRNEVFRYRPVR